MQIYLRTFENSILSHITPNVLINHPLRTKIVIFVSTLFAAIVALFIFVKYTKKSSLTPFKKPTITPKHTLKKTIDVAKVIIDSGGFYQAKVNTFKIHSISDVHGALQKAKNESKKITIGGTLHSQAGHATLDNALHLDMIGFNKIISTDLEHQTITVESGATWEKILQHLTPLQFSPHTMQDNCIFTVGGSLSSNISGRSPHHPPFIESVVSFTLMDAKGNIHKISRNENAELFSLVIGGYGLFGVVLEVTLKIIPNDALTEKKEIILKKDYEKYLNKISSDTSAVFSSGYFYPDQEKISMTTYYSLGRKASSNGKELSKNNILMMKPQNQYGIPGNSNNFIGYSVPKKNFPLFMEQVKKDIQDSGLEIVVIRLKSVKKDSESVLSFAKEESVILTPMFRLTFDNHKKSVHLKKLLTQQAVNFNGNVYLTFSHEINEEEMRKLYPRWDYFLEKKRQHDPQEIFSSQFYEKWK